MRRLIVPNWGDVEDLRTGALVSAVSIPMNRSKGRALIVGQPALRAAPTSAMQDWGFTCAGVDEPYDAMVQLCRRPLFFSAIVLSLNSLYREELQIIESLKRRFSHIDVWLTDTDGRQTALADAVRLGADGLLGERGLQRINSPKSVEQDSNEVVASPLPSNFSKATASGKEESPVKALVAGSVGDTLHRSTNTNEALVERASAGVDPLLTAEELRALLQDAPDANPA